MLATKVTPGGGEVRVVGCLIAGGYGLPFGEAPAHRHHRHAGLAGGGGHAGHQVGQRLAVGLDQDDLRPRSDGMGPFDVERFLDFPVVDAGAVGVGRGSDVAWPLWLSTVKNDDAGPYCW